MYYELLESLNPRFLRPSLNPSFVFALQTTFKTIAVPAQNRPCALVCVASPL